MTVNKNHGTKNTVRTITAVGVFIALAYICALLFRFKASFLSFDIKDAVMTVGAMFFGPIYGLAMSVIISLLEFFTVGSTGVYGLIMDFISSAAFVCTASLVYSFRRTFKGAVLGMIAAVLFMTAAMVGANMIVTPIYMHMKLSEVMPLIPTLILPFNLIKAIFNASIAFLIYKPASLALRQAGFIKGGVSAASAEYKFKPAALIIPVALAVGALLVFFFVMNGSLSLLSAS